jgi:hypothetical protein
VVYLKSKINGTEEFSPHALRIAKWNLPDPNQDQECQQVTEMTTHSGSLSPARQWLRAWSPYILLPMLNLVKFSDWEILSQPSSSFSFYCVEHPKMPWNFGSIPSSEHNASWMTMEKQLLSIQLLIIPDPHWKEFLSLSFESGQPPSVLAQEDLLALWVPLLEYFHGNP